MARPTCTPNPSQTEGPHWVDEMLNRADIRSDPVSRVVQQGLPLRLALNVSEIQAGSCSPVSGCYVNIWHCNALGVYSDVQAQGTVGQRFLRGYQAADSQGNVRFLTIYPGFYNGRTVHIHFRVRKFSGSQTTFSFVSQLYFNDTVTTGVFQRVAPYSSRTARTTTNSNDGIYSSAMLLRLADNTSHASASFNNVINANPGLAGLDTTPTDPDSLEHQLDFGGARRLWRLPDSAPTERPGYPCPWCPRPRRTSLPCRTPLTRSAPNVHTHTPNHHPVAALDRRPRARACERRRSLEQTLRTPPREQRVPPPVGG
jgi:protocatechuate 3,4-dioxygenase beta subunit